MPRHAPNSCQRTRDEAQTNAGRGTNERGTRRDRTQGGVRLCLVPRSLTGLREGLTKRRKEASRGERWPRPLPLLLKNRRLSLRRKALWRHQTDHFDIKGKRCLKEDIIFLQQENISRQSGFICVKICNFENCFGPSVRFMIETDAEAPPCGKMRTLKEAARRAAVSFASTVMSGLSLANGSDSPLENGTI